MQDVTQHLSPNRAVELIHMQNPSSHTRQNDCFATDSHTALIITP